MWLDRQVYDDLRLSEAEAKGKATALDIRITAMDTMMDWFRVRLTQLEKERAQLIHRYTGVVIETPVFAKEPEKPIEQILSEVSSFDDVGDEVAKRLGIGFKSDGTLEYTRLA